MNRGVRRAPRLVAAIMALVLAAPTMDAIAQTAHQNVPSAEQFQKLIPKDALVQSSRTVHGRDAVKRFDNQLGINISELRSLLNSSPLDGESTNVSAVHARKESISVTEALATTVMPDGVRPMATEGDTQTNTWSSNG